MQIWSCNVRLNVIYFIKIVHIIWTISKILILFVDASVFGIEYLIQNSSFKLKQKIRFRDLLQNSIIVS